MFTGLIESCQPLLTFDNNHAPALLTIDKPFEATVGDSIAVDGCCLTVSECNQSSLTFGLSAETLATTHFVANLTNAPLISYRVNIERAMVLGDRLHGHLVSGHIDGVATVINCSDLLELSLPRHCYRYLADKGSLAINGVSLTVNRTRLTKDSCVVQITLIDTTMTKTNLGTVAVGQLVNFELDMIAKYLDKLRNG